MVLEKKIFKFRQCIFVISSLSNLGKGHGPTFKDNWILSPQRCPVPSLVEIGLVVLRKKVFKFREYIFATPWLSPLGKGHDHSFEQTWIPFTQDALCQVWFLRRKDENVKSFQTDRRTNRRTDRRTTDDRRLEKLTWGFSSGELKCKVYFKLHVVHNCSA